LLLYPSLALPHFLHDHHHPVCILISAVVHTAPLPHRSPNAPLALVAILINSLTLEVYSTAASTTQLKINVGDWFMITRISISISTCRWAAQPYAHLFLTLDMA
jgi:hypothetical protein